MGQTSTPEGGTDVSARYYDGRTSGATAVRLSFGRCGLVTLTGAARSANYKLEELDISTRIGNTPRLNSETRGPSWMQRSAIQRTITMRATSEG